MSDGDWENKREHERHRFSSGTKSGGDEYAKAIAKVAVAQVCQNEGFQTFQLSALYTLSDVTIRYMHNIGKTALLYANSAGRTDGNHFDVIQGLEELSAGQGFAGASETDHCLAHSGVVHEISQYVSDYEEVPFAYDLWRFPVDRERNHPQSFLQIGEEPPEEHIPGWLPKFPDPKTYDTLLKESAEVHDRDVNLQFVKHQDRSQNELPLPNMPYLISSNGFPGPSSADSRNTVKTNETLTLNPYLSAPIRIVEKGASPGPTRTPPEKPPGNVLEGNAPQINIQNADRNIFVSKTSTPANIAVSGKSTDPNEQQLLSKQRNPVQFKIKIRKKPLVSGMMPSDGFMDKSSQHSCRNSGECDVNYATKERTRKILKESVESPQDVA
ncbi:hypothetical protein MLD38_022553 [Melastoma candidum]|uniref:Uncharacterized protein n=1 Tax=Melastoma candidum TaxID=119954 RepID=A0ACB9QK67_9MYRT|nr:hypothetical protein MLD38_022553 [Melastoma candidum]